MKKIFTTPKFFLASLAVVCLLLLAGSANAQTFKILPGKVITKTYSFAGIDDNAHAFIENTSTGNIRLKWQRLSNNLDSLNWQTSLCDNDNCYPGVPDSVTMSAIKPGQQAELKLSYIIDPQDGSKAGVGVVKMVINDVNNPFVTDTVTFIIGATTTGIDEEERNNAQISIYPNPTADVINIASTVLNLGRGNMSIYNTLGAKIEDIKLSSDAINTVPVSQLPAGVYYIRYQGVNGEAATRSFMKR